MGKTIGNIDLTLTEFENGDVHLYFWENDDSEFSSGYEAQINISKEKMIKMAKFIIDKLGG